MDDVRRNGIGREGKDRWRMREIEKGGGGGGIRKKDGDGKRMMDLGVKMMMRKIGKMKREGNDRN